MQLSELIYFYCFHHRLTFRLPCIGRWWPYGWPSSRFQWFLVHVTLCCIPYLSNSTSFAISCKNSKHRSDSIQYMHAAACWTYRECPEYYGTASLNIGIPSTWLMQEFIPNQHVWHCRHHDMKLQNNVINVHQNDWHSFLRTSNSTTLWQPL